LSSMISDAATPLDRLRSECRARDIVAACALTRENTLYATGFDDPVSAALGLPVAALVDLRADPIVTLVASVAAVATIVDLPSRPDNIVLYGVRRSRSGAGALSERERRAVETHESARFTDTFEEALRAALALAELKESDIAWDRSAPHDAVWRAARRVKTSAEIELLRDAAAIAEEAGQHLIDRCDIGREWRHVAAVECDVFLRGALPGLVTSGAGTESSLMSTSPEYRLREGDIVRIDLCCRYGGYWADVGRTIVLGAPSAEIQSRYDALTHGVDTGLAAVRPGVASKDVHRCAIEAVRRGWTGSYEYPHCGHSIGLSLYDGDRLDPVSDEPLEAGMVLNIELPYYELGWGGLQLEETFLVTDGGYELITRSPRTLVRR
jgi:Xaa-Pro aminopeptidase